MTLGSPIDAKRALYEAKWWGTLRIAECSRNTDAERESRLRAECRGLIDRYSRSIHNSRDDDELLNALIGIIERERAAPNEHHEAVRKT